MPDSARANIERWALALLGSVGIFVALAYFLGKRYTDAYYGEFGIPESALNFSPPEIAVASETFLVSALVLAVLALAQWFMPNDLPTHNPETAVGRTLTGYYGFVKAFLGEHPVSDEWKWLLRVVRTFGSIAILILLFGYLSIGIGDFPDWVYLVCIAAYIFVFASLRGASEGMLVWFVLAVFFLLLIGYMVSGPTTLGQRDAKDVLTGHDHLPRAALHLAGDEPNLVEGSVDGILRGELILLSEDIYYVLVRGQEHDPPKVVSVNKDFIESITYEVEPHQ